MDVRFSGRLLLVIVSDVSVEDDMIRTRTGRRECEDDVGEFSKDDMTRTTRIRSLVLGKYQIQQ